MQYEIEAYKTEDGRIPYEEAVLAIRDRRAKLAIMRRVQRAKLGNLGDHHYLGDGLHEMRIDHGPGYRIYYGWNGTTLLILFLAGDKGSQDSDIKRAKIYMEDYRSKI